MDFAIDRGGTFTDVFARDSNNGTVIVTKLLSEDPSSYQDAPREGIRRVLQQVTNKTITKDQPIDTSYIRSIRMGTTIATNALLERKGEECCLVVTKGFRDLLRIGTQARENIFDLEICKPELLYKQVIEINERVRVLHDFEEFDGTIKTGVSGERIAVLKELDPAEVRKKLEYVFQSGIRSICVVFMHSYTFHNHELQVGQIAQEIGFANVSMSSQLIPMVKIVSRGRTANADAYLTPGIVQYIDKFVKGFDSKLLERVKISFMQSDGGLASIESFSGFKAVLSGPAGGVVGYSRCFYDEKEPLIGFDMGGTSTDVSRFDGEFEQIMENSIGGTTIQAPQLDINTVAAGGGSRLFFKNELFVVGPESAGANPGPACYGKGGPAAVTDANAVLGRIIPDHFPKIFGPNFNMPLNVEASRRALSKLAESAGSDSIEEVALGFVKVANEAMCRPIRNLTQGKGFDTSKHVLAVFGGAGGQHSCAVARRLGIRRVVIHKYSGILSAFGIGLADEVIESQEPSAGVEFSTNSSVIFDKLSNLESEVFAKLEKIGGFSSIEIEKFVNLRYKGTDAAIMVKISNSQTPVDIFQQTYQREYGFTLDREILVDDVRVRGSGKSAVAQELKNSVNSSANSSGEGNPCDERKVYFSSGWLDTKLYKIEELIPSYRINGPALLIGDTTTIVVEPDCVAWLTSEGHIVLDLSEMHSKRLNHSLASGPDSILLSIFSHRFMSIAEQMGRALQRTSLSTNIKERLDFSCAIFGPNGGLVANAPHLPVHLGAMQDAVRYQKEYLGDSWKPGDVVISNHPCAGGSHLPDITVITPVFSPDKDRRFLFFLASRGHHADIGGITPGSMPPFSKTLSEEGVQIVSFKIVKEGCFQEKKLVEIFTKPQGDGIPGTRCLEDNISDLRAQIGANEKGRQLVERLILEYGLEVVQAYMIWIQDNAERTVRSMLRKLVQIHKKDVLEAVDYLDDGSIIQLKIFIDESDGSAIFDFSGTSNQIYGNLNAPAAVTYSATIYSLRCLVGENIPLNQGCLAPISIRIPENSILCPSNDAAVVGGNVLTSQRVTDVILKAFGACAASQGCMNNLTFGDSSFGYYETIAGGAGAGPNWHGQSGVHTHMTNTRITDPEILERRYPVQLQQFSLRRGSGGRGLYRGGDGVIREIKFLKCLSVGILSERRVFAPYGMNGGEDGQKGRNTLIRSKDGVEINLGSKNTFSADPGDILSIESPGGGGFGTPRDHPDADDGPTSKKRRLVLNSGSVAAYKARQEQE